MLDYDRWLSPHRYTTGNGSVPMVHEAWWSHVVEILVCKCIRSTDRLELASLLFCASRNVYFCKTWFVKKMEVKVKVKFTLEQATTAQRVIRGIALIFNIVAGWERVVNVTSRPLYPQESPGTYCKGGWVHPSSGIDRRGKSRPQ
jgi:hypothetical protein